MICRFRRLSENKTALREAKSSDGVERGGYHRKSRKVIPYEVGAGNDIKGVYKRFFVSSIEPTNKREENQACLDYPEREGGRAIAQPTTAH